MNRPNGAGGSLAGSTVWLRPGSLPTLARHVAGLRGPAATLFRLGLGLSRRRCRRVSRRGGTSPTRPRLSARPRESIPCQVLPAFRRLGPCRFFGRSCSRLRCAASAGNSLRLRRGLFFRPSRPGGAPLRLRSRGHATSVPRMRCQDVAHRGALSRIAPATSTPPRTRQTTNRANTVIGNQSRHLLAVRGDTRARSASDAAFCAPMGRHPAPARNGGGALCSGGRRRRSSTAADAAGPAPPPASILELSTSAAGWPDRSPPARPTPR